MLFTGEIGMGCPVYFPDRAVSQLSQTSGQVVAHFLHVLHALKDACGADAYAHGSRHHILNGIIGLHDSAGCIQVHELRVFFGYLVIVAHGNGSHGSSCHPAKAVPAHHLGRCLLNINLQRGADGINGADTVGAVLQTFSGSSHCVGPVAGQLADNGNVHMRLGIVQHGNQGILCIGNQLNHMGSGTFHILYNGLGLL